MDDKAKQLIWACYDKRGHFAGLSEVPNETRRDVERMLSHPALAGRVAAWWKSQPGPHTTPYLHAFSLAAEITHLWWEMSADERGKAGMGKDEARGVLERCYGELLRGRV